MQTGHPIPTGVDATLKRELYFFSLYRLLQATLLVFVVFSPLQTAIDVHQVWLARTISLLYLPLAFALLMLCRRSHWRNEHQVMLGLALDIAVALLAKHAIGGIDSGVSLLLLVNVGAGAVILSLRASIIFAFVAATGTLLEYALSRLGPFGHERELAATVMFSVTYLSVSLLCHLLGKQMRESAQLADQRGEQLASLSQLNELIIRRMRTGVLVVDSAGKVRLMNEASWMLLGEPSPDQRSVEQLAPQLHQRWTRWRLDAQQDTTPLVLAKDRPQVSPHFAKLTMIDELSVMFLDDSSLVSRRAEELTLSTLGRLSASIAHEIRNPLAAIHHAAQLLEESPDIPEADQQLVEIVVNHCVRMNDIVENVLALSRRERSRPESIELSVWLSRFVDEFRSNQFNSQHDVSLVTGGRLLHAMIDPRQLHQVVSALIQNALTYGRLPDQSARVTLTARTLGEGGPPVIEVMDRGPGVPAAVAVNIFEPFFTTSEFGSGLGLYIARQLCEANQASLDYISLAGGGSCFRITLSRPQVLRSPHEPAPARPVAARSG